MLLPLSALLRFAAERSASDRQLFYVVGGRLARPSERGRLEFRVTPDGNHLLTASTTSCRHCRGGCID